MGAEQWDLCMIFEAGRAGWEKKQVTRERTTRAACNMQSSRLELVRSPESDGKGALNREASENEDWQALRSVQRSHGNAAMGCRAGGGNGNLWEFRGDDSK